MEKLTELVASQVEFISDTEVILNGPQGYAIGKIDGKEFPCHGDRLDGLAIDLVKRDWEEYICLFRNNELMAGYESICLDGQIKHVGYCCFGRYVAVVTEDKLELLNVNSLARNTLLTRPIKCFSASFTGSVCVLNRSDNPRVMTGYDVLKEKYVFTIECHSDIVDVQYSWDGQYIAVTFVNHDIFVYKVCGYCDDRLIVRETYTISNNYNRPVTKLKFSWKNGNLYWACGSYLYKFDCSSGRTQYYPISREICDVCDVAISYDESKFICACQTGVYVSKLEKKVEAPTESVEAPTELDKEPVEYIEKISESIKASAEQEGEDDWEDLKEDAKLEVVPSQQFAFSLELYTKLIRSIKKRRQTQGYVNKPEATFLINIRDGDKCHVYGLPVYSHEMTVIIEEIKKLEQDEVPAKITRQDWNTLINLSGVDSTLLK